MRFAVYGTIKNRRGIRKYFSKNVSDDALQRILEAARWAPSAHNAQPWRFVVVKDYGVKRKLAEAMARKWNKDLKEDGVPPSDRERLIQSSLEQFTHPPILIIACLTMKDMNKYSDERRQKAEYLMAVQSVAAAIQNLLLAAHAEGLSTCWFCAPLFCQETIRKVLKASKDIEPQALITLGYPAEKPKPPLRKPLESLMHQNYWGKHE